MLIPAIKSAFDLADGAFDLLISSPSEPDGNIKEAQQDLISYLFESILSDPGDWSDVYQIY